MEKLIQLPTKETLENPFLLKKLVSAHRHLAELKGIVQIIPNEKFYL